MTRNQKLVALLVLLLSWAFVAVATFAVTRETSRYEPPFGDYDFDRCLNEGRNRDWCDAYFTALDDTWRFVNEIQGTPNGQTAIEPSNEKVTLVVVDKMSEGTVIYEMEPLPDGECPPSPSMEIIVEVTAGGGPSGASTSMNENCEIVIDEIR